jgi:hypothetical protein
MSGAMDESAAAADSDPSPHAGPVPEPAPVPDEDPGIDIDLENLDLFIISDAPDYIERRDRYFPKNDVFQPETGFKRWLLNRTLKFYAYFWITLFLLGVISLVLVFWGLFSVWWGSGMGILQSIWQAITGLNVPRPLVIGLVAMVFVAIPIMIVNLALMGWAWFQARKLEDFLERMIPRRGALRPKALWHYVKNLMLGELWHMLELRLLSVLRLTSEIFMNRVRQLCYIMLYEKDELGKRVIASEIFKLKVIHDPENAAAGNFTAQNFPLPLWLLQMNTEMSKVIETSVEMKTQLYLDDPGLESLRILAACGHLTTCFNLLEYLWQNHSDGNGNFPGRPEAEALFEDAKEMWDQLVGDPYIYVNERVPLSP